MRGPRLSNGYCQLVRRGSVWLLLLTPFLVTLGCGSKQQETPETQAVNAKGQSGSAPAAPSDADMKKSFSQKSFDINNVPPEQRERVKAIMQQNAASQPSASPQGK